jgi:putative transcription factor
MECEMCGKTIGTRRYLVDGTTMNLGTCCARYGTPMDQAAPAGSPAAMQQGLERRAAKQTRRDVYADTAEDLVADYGRRIREAREVKGWTHEQLGNKVSARVPELHKIEANQLRPSDEVARRMEKELGIKLFEKVEVGAGAASSKPAAGLTLGDLLKDALKKK